VRRWRCVLCARSLRRRRELIRSGCKSRLTQERQGRRFLRFFSPSQVIHVKGNFMLTFTERVHAAQAATPDAAIDQPFDPREAFIGLCEILHDRFVGQNEKPVDLRIVELAARVMPMPVSDPVPVAEQSGDWKIPEPVPSTPPAAEVTTPPFVADPEPEPVVVVEPVPVAADPVVVTPEPQAEPVPPPVVEVPSAEVTPAPEPELVPAVTEPAKDLFATP